MICPTCSTQNNEDNKFCLNCGTKLFIQGSDQKITQNAMHTSQESETQKRVDHNKFLEPQYNEQNRTEEPEVDNPTSYYLAALFWPIGIYVLLTSTSGKPVIAKQMKEILSFSILLSIFLFWLFSS